MSVDDDDGLEQGADDDLDLVSRRTFLKATASGVAATGLGAGPVGEMGLSPVGRSEAAICGGICAATAGIVVGAAAGLAVTKWREASGTDTDTSGSNGAIADSMYSAAAAVATGRSRFVDEMVTQYQDSATGESPYADVAWSEVRATAAQEIVNGSSESEAKSAARDALDRQTTVSMWNIAQRWNTAMTSLIGVFEGENADRSSGIGLAYVDGNDNNSITCCYHNEAGIPVGNSMPVSADAVAVDTYTADNGDGYFAENEMSNPPMDPSNIDAIEGDRIFFYYACAKDAGGGGYDIHNLATGGAFGAGNWTNDFNGIAVRDSNGNNVTALATDPYMSAVQRIDTEYNNIVNDLDTYITNLKSALDSGSIDASDIISPTDLVDQFSGSDAQARTAAELAGVGAAVGDNLSYQARVSHPDISADDLWVDLFIRWSAEPYSLSPDTTIPASDYNLAYIGYVSSASGEYVTDVLSGSSGLQILEIDQTDENTEGLDQVEGEKINDDGTLTLGDDDNLPVGVTSPSQVDGDWSVVLTDSTGTTETFAAGDLEYDSATGEYTVPDSATGFSGGELVESAEAIKSPSQDQPVEHVDDPSSVDTETVESILEAQGNLQDKIKKLEEAANSGGAAGGIFGGGFWDWLPADAKVQAFEENVPGGTETVAAGGGIGLFAWLS